MLYGMGALTLSESLNISEHDAHKLILEFKNTFPGVSTFFNECITQCRSIGLVKTLSGRIRHLPDINNDVPKIKGTYYFSLIILYIYFKYIFYCIII